MNPSGEVKIEIKGVSYRMRPSFKCLSRIEEDCNTGVSKMVLAMSKGDIRFSHIASIIYNGILAGEDKAKCPSLDEVGEWLLKGNMASVTPSVIAFFQEAMVAGPKED